MLLVSRSKTNSGYLPCHSPVILQLRKYPTLPSIPDFPGLRPACVSKRENRYWLVPQDHGSRVADSKAHQLGRLVLFDGYDLRLLSEEWGLCRHVQINIHKLQIPKVYRKLNNICLLIFYPPKIPNISMKIFISLKKTALFWKMRKFVLEELVQIGCLDLILLVWENLFRLSFNKNKIIGLRNKT